MTDIEPTKVVQLDRTKYQVGLVIRREAGQTAEQFARNEMEERLLTTVLSSTEEVRVSHEMPATWVQHLRKRLRLSHRTITLATTLDVRATFPALKLAVPDSLGPVVFHVEENASPPDDLL